MGSGNPNIREISKGTQWPPGQSGNTAGKPKGAIHLSTHIQNLLNDDDFFPENTDNYKQLPIKAIIRTAVIKAQEGDTKWADWLAKYGYGNKLEIEHSGEIKGEVDPEVAKRFKDFLAQDTVDG